MVSVMTTNLGCTETIAAGCGHYGREPRGLCDTPVTCTFHDKSPCLTAVRCYDKTGSPLLGAVSQSFEKKKKNQVRNTSCLTY